MGNEKLRQDLSRSVWRIADQYESAFIEGVDALRELLDYDTDDEQFAAFRVITSVDDPFAVISCIIELSGNGPSFWIDTNAGMVCGSDDQVKASAPLSLAVCAAINEYGAELHALALYGALKRVRSL